MAKVPSPVHSRKGTPPAPTQTVANLEKPELGTIDNLNFKVAPELKRAFRIYAMSRGMTAKDLLERCFEFYRQHHGE
ncbi:MAG TPA: hypothetical protein VFK06_06670 [Candidatus Angelobacter sp.]|nr:hypothetical protein [Candidatus Angelobacter sp.]